MQGLSELLIQDPQEVAAIMERLPKPTPPPEPPPDTTRATARHTTRATKNERATKRVSGGVDQLSKLEPRQICSSLPTMSSSSPGGLFGVLSLATSSTNPRREIVGWANMKHQANASGFMLSQGFHACVRVCMLRRPTHLHQHARRRWSELSRGVGMRVCSVK
eukprot:COSAG01_NODE_3387_length_6153_cov_17.057483_1_plen_163_part_00